MKDAIIFIGLDVDDTSYHGAALSADTGEVIEFKCRPTLKGLVGQLDKVRAQFPGGTLQVCYEASYVGYCLQRDLTERGVHCDVVSPSHIPKPRGKAIKTDRIDAAQLAQFYAKDLLTVVDIPDAESESDRDLMRSRQYLLGQQGKLRRHLHALLRGKFRPTRAEGVILFGVECHERCGESRSIIHASRLPVKRPASGL